MECAHGSDRVSVKGFYAGKGVQLFHLRKLAAPARDVREECSLGQDDTRAQSVPQNSAVDEPLTELC